jgi:GT2 family glycosyltransferase
MIQVSVVLPTFNRLDRLKRVIAGLEAQTFPHDQFEVIVVSDGSSDGTHEYMQSIASPLNITYLHQVNQGVSVARNAGVARASAALLLFVDDDVVPIPELMAEHVASQAEKNQVVIGPMLNPADFVMSPWVRWEQLMLMKQYDDMNQQKWAPTPRQFYTGNASVPREWVVSAGGFDPALRRAEDVDLAYRLADRGAQFAFNARAIGWHYAERSFESWIRIPYDYGRNDVIFARQRAQPWLLTKIASEYRRRHVFIRILTGLGLDRPRRATFLNAILRKTSQIDKLSRFSCSGMFNLRYFQGVSDQLGGRAQFFAEVARAKNVPE